MNPIDRFLYRYQILKLSERKIERWNRNESVDKLIFAANNGVYNIRIRCIEFLSGRISEPKVKFILTSMISDNVEVVSEAAIKALDKSATSELTELIEQTRQKWKAKKNEEKRINSCIANAQFGDTSKTRPSERLMNRLRAQQKTNDPPYGF